MKAIYRLIGSLHENFNNIINTHSSIQTVLEPERTQVGVGRHHGATSNTLGLIYTIRCQVWLHHTLRISVEVWYPSIVRLSVERRACLHGTCSPKPKSVGVELSMTDMSGYTKNNVWLTFCVL